MSLGNLADVAELREEFERLSRCCLAPEKTAFDPVAILAQARPFDGKYAYQDQYGLVVFENSDGRFGVFEDAEDSSGHG